MQPTWLLVHQSREARGRALLACAYRVGAGAYAHMHPTDVHAWRAANWAQSLQARLAPVLQCLKYNCTVLILMPDIPIIHAHACFCHRGHGWNTLEIQFKPSGGYCCRRLLAEQPPAPNLQGQPVSSHAPLLFVQAIVHVCCLPTEQQ